MAAPHVHLQFQFADAAQADGALDHPLLAMLAAVQAAGSIQRAAAALGVSYRHLWGALKRWEGQLGQPLVLWTQGHPARLTPAALRLLTGTRLACARQAAQIDALRAAMDQALATALGTAPPALAIVASPEPVLALLRRRLQAAGLLHLQLQADTSWGALRALAEGRCAVAAVHRPPPGTPFDAGLAALLAGGAHRVLLRVQRRQGLMLAPGNPLLLEVPAALARPGVRVVGRPAGSGTRALLEQWLAGTALALVAEEPSHDAAATAVACGLGDAAPGTEAAALAAGLHFVPLLHDDWLLLAASAALHQPAVQTLQQQLQAPAWHAAVATLPGHRVVPD